MLRDGAIEATNVWKRFRPDRVDSLLRYEIERLAARFTRRELEWQWALRDITMHAEPGESIGLVGNNGSGKSTFLKILTGVMDQYAGRVATAGRIGALIEVKAGISPDLTGRENINLYGTLLGLSRKEVADRFDEIVSFAQLEESIDRQVKFYSSGMQMRLGFAVAAYLEPDILLVDEVLAVGDAAFQARCLDRMREVLASGTTLVFVSHDLHAVASVCNRCIWLRYGEVITDGPVGETLSAYRADIEHAAELAMSGVGEVQISKVSAMNPETGVPMTQQPLDLTFHVDSDEYRELRFFVGITEGTADPIFGMRRNMEINAGTTEIRFEIQNLPLPRGRFYIWIAVIDDRTGSYLLRWHPTIHFDVSGPDLDKTPASVVRRAPVHVAYTFDSSPVATTSNGSNGVTTNGPEPAPPRRRTTQLRARR